MDKIICTNDQLNLGRVYPSRNGVALLNNTTNLRRMLETVMLSVIAIVLIILGNNPVLSFLIFVSAVPIIVLTARQGVAAGLSGSVLVTALLFLFGGVVLAASGGIMFGFAAVAMGHMIRRKVSTTQSILIGSLAFSVGFSILVIATIRLTGTDPFAAMNLVFEDAITGVQKQALSSNLSQEDVNLQIKEFKRVQTLINNVKPAMVIMIGFMLAVTNFFTARPILKSTGVEVKQMTKFSQHRLPKDIVPGIFLLMVMTFIADALGYVDQEIIFLNLEFIFVWIFFLQGISIMSFIASARGGNTAKRSVLFIFLGIALIPFHGLELIASLGFIDTVFDIRKLYENRKV